MSYTASATLARIKSKGFVSTSGSLTEAELLPWLDDSLRSYVVPFLKAVRDEWFVSGTEDVTPDSNARIPMPNSVASTIRTIAWNQNGLFRPLTRIEPENQFAFIGQAGGNQPYGYMLRGYEIQSLPTNIGSVSVRIQFMERPAEMVLEEDAGLIASHVGLALTLDSVPLAWQETTPTAVDLISSNSPFEAVAESVTVVSLVGSVLTLSGISSALVEDGFWVSDVGASPFPNLPIELHPLLQRSVITEIYSGTGDKRLDSSMKLQAKLESELRKTMAPRTQGSARPIVNKNGPGMNRTGRWVR